MNTKMETMSSKIKQLESKAASSSRQHGQLPGKAEANPKEYVQAITLRSGTVIPTREIPIKLNEDIEIQSGGEKLEIENDEALDAKDKVVRDAAKGKGLVEDIEKVEPRVVIQDSETKEVIPKQGKAERVVVKGTWKPEMEKEVKPKYVPPPPYVPKLPFPGRFKKQLMEKYKAAFDENIKKVEMTMPLVDAFLLVPQYAKFLKEMVAQRAKEIEGMVVLTHECSSVIQKKVVLKKLEDPGCFTLPCALGPLEFERCLCDLGASVSLMPLTVAKRLGFSQYKRSKISLILADRSIRLPIGLLEDLPVMLGEYIVPTDFVVLEMDEEPKDPLIFGRPFLATAGALIDAREGKIDLRLGKKDVLTFDIKEMMKRPTIDGQVFHIQTMDELANELLEELTSQDHLQIALTKEEGKHGFIHDDSEEYARILDSHGSMDKEVPVMGLEKKEDLDLGNAKEVFALGLEKKSRQRKI